MSGSLPSPTAQFPMPQGQGAFPTQGFTGPGTMPQGPPAMQAQLPQQWAPHPGGNLAMFGNVAQQPLFPQGAQSPTGMPGVGGAQGVHPYLQALAPLLQALQAAQQQQGQPGGGGMPPPMPQSSPLQQNFQGVPQVTAQTPFQTAAMGGAQGGGVPSVAPPTTAVPGAGLPLPPAPPPAPPVNLSQAPTFDPSIQSAGGGGEGGM